MATSSITKEFVIKDKNAYLKIAEEINSKPKRIVKVTSPSNIKRGTELLKQFSFR